MLDLSPAKQFADLRDISEEVAEYLDRELFEDTFGRDSDYTTNDVLTECYTIVLQELTEYGISFTVVPEDLLEDWYTAHKLYDLRYILDAANLYNFLKLYPEDISQLSQLIEDNEEDAIQDILDYLTEQHPDDVHIQQLSDLTAIIQSNHRLNDHISAVINNLNDIDATIVIPDVSRATRYIAKIQAARRKVAEDVEKIITTLPLQNWDRAILNKVLDVYDLDKITPSEIKIYSLIDLDSDIPSALDEIKHRYLEQHHARSLHHIEYWLTHPEQQIQKEHLAVLVAHHAEPGATALEFWNGVENMRAKGTPILTPDQIQLLEDMAACLYPRTEGGY